MTVHQLVPLFAFGLNAILIVSALVSDHRSALNRSFAYFACAQAVWNLGSFGLRGSGDPAQAFLWEVILHVGVIPIPILFYRYVVIFLDLPTRRRSLFVGYALCAFFLAVSPTPLFMRGVQQTYWGWAPLSGPLYAAFFVYFQTFMVLGLVRLVRARRAQTSSYWRSRILLVMVGVTLSLFGGAIDFLRFILGLERLYPVGIPTNSLAGPRARTRDRSLSTPRYECPGQALAPLLVDVDRRAALAHSRRLDCSPCRPGGGLRR